MNSAAASLVKTALGRHVLLRGIVLMLLVLCTSACATHRDPVSFGTEMGRNSAENDAADPAVVRLWRERMADPQDFVIGPGDVLEVSVPGLDEINKSMVRVGADGTITLPFAGSLTLAGLTQKSARDRIRTALARYMYEPDVQLFVQKYASRQVAVVGAVRNPGTFTLNGPDDTVRTLIDRAGGLTPDASEQAVLTPARPESDTRCPASASSASDSEACPADAATLKASYPHHTGTVPYDGSSGASDSRSSAQALRINLKPRREGTGLGLGLPVRPGDTIFVPGAGSATVVGWVQKPNVVPITPGLTVLGAVSASGGPLFAADLKSVQLIRQEPNGRNQVLALDLEKVVSGEGEDIALRSNDIVSVPYSVARLPGYALYYAAQSVFSWAPAALLVTGIP